MKAADMYRQVTGTPATNPPSYFSAAKMLSYAKSLDCSPMLHKEADVQPPGRQKVVCGAGGAVAQVCFEWMPHASQHFTGMFREAQHCLIWCSSATQPQVPSIVSPIPGMVPMVGLKFFRDGSANSSNVCLAYRKSGQSESNFLRHAISKPLY